MAFPSRSLGTRGRVSRCQVGPLACRFSPNRSLTWACDARRPHSPRTQPPPSPRRCLVMKTPIRLALLVAPLLLPVAVRADDLPVLAAVEGQPLAANAERVAQALQLLGAPLPEATAKA